MTVTTWFIAGILFWILADVAFIAHGRMPDGHPNDVHTLWTFVGNVCMIVAVLKWIFD